MPKRPKVEVRTIKFPIADPQVCVHPQCQYYLQVSARGLSVFHGASDNCVAKYNCEGTLTCWGWAKVPQPQVCRVLQPAVSPAVEPPLPPFAHTSLCSNNVVALAFGTLVFALGGHPLSGAGTPLSQQTLLLKAAPH